jgi:hypothetical protein
MIKTPAPLRVNIDSHPSGILIHIATERLFSSLESAIASWELREKAIRRAESLGRKAQGEPKIIP